MAPRRSKGRWPSSRLHSSSTLIPILLFTRIRRAETLLINLMMGLLSMLLDAMAWWGLDKSAYPCAQFLLLQAFVNLCTMQPYSWPSSPSRSS